MRVFRSRTGRTTGGRRQAVRWARWGVRLENALLCVLLGGLILLAASQIVLRNVFSTGLPWADPLVRMTVLWLALAGGIAAARDRKQIAIDAVTRLLPERARRIADTVGCLFAFAVTTALAWQSLRFLRDSWTFGDTVFGDWPAWPFQLILPIGFAAIACRYLLRAMMPGPPPGPAPGPAHAPAPGSGPGADPNAEPDARTAAGRDAGSGAGSAQWPAAGSGAGPHPGSGAGSDAGSAARPAAEPDAAPDADPNAAPDADPNAAPDADPNAAPDADPNAAPDVGSATGPAAGPAAEPVR